MSLSIISLANVCEFYESFKYFGIYSKIFRDLNCTVYIV